MMAVVGTWIARVEWTTTAPAPGQDLDDVVLEHVIGDRHTYSTTLTVEAPTLQTATAAAVEHVATRTGETIDGVQVLRPEAHEHRAKYPRLPPMVSYGDLAQLLGMTRQSARELAAVPGFPAPVLTTAAGPIRTRAAVEEWLTNWQARRQPVDDLTAEHVAELLRTCIAADRPDLARATALVAIAGLALKEALRVSWGDVAADLSELRIRPPKGHEHHRTRVVTPPARTRDRLGELLGPRGSKTDNVVSGTVEQLDYRRVGGTLQRTMRSLYGTDYGAQDLARYFDLHGA
jgi:integrase